MNFQNAVFRRLFSVNLRKKLRIRLAEMSFENDFTDTVRGDMYPAVTLDEETKETINNGVYKICGGCARRLICEHFPFAEYCINIGKLSGKVGISFINSASDALVDMYITNTATGYTFAYTVNNSQHRCNIDIPGDARQVSFGTRGQTIDVYYCINGHFSLAGSVDIPELGTACDIPFPFKALLFCEAEEFETDGVEVYIDNGVAFADMKPIRYTDGGLMQTDGRIYFTMSSRLGAGGYQSIVSWLPFTADFQLEGAIFFNIDGKEKISGDIASCVLFDRENREYLIWMCAFSSGHILGYGKTTADILHSLSIIDITLMNKTEGASDTDFSAFEGDEDPDFYYDGEKGKWFLSVCRIRENNGSRSYSYVKFVSDNPFTGYRFYRSTDRYGETGGMTTLIDGKRYFMCGADMSSESLYRIYDADSLELITEARYDYPDGGFRGWGTLLPINCGNRQRIVQITFDRVLGSDFNWSYGNLYAFEAIEQAKENKV